MENKINIIYDKVRQNNAGTEAEKNFTKSTMLPVLAISVIDIAYSQSDTPSGIGEIVELVASDLLYRYLEDIINTVNQSTVNLQNAQIDSAKFDQFRDNLRDTRKIIDQKRRKFAQDYQMINLVTGRFKQQERILHEAFLAKKGDL